MKTLAIFKAAIVVAALCISAELPVFAFGSGGSGGGGGTGGGGGGGGTLPPGTLSLKVSDEVAPPDGVAQIKLLVTEPRPITRGSTSLTYDPTIVDSFLGISVTSPSGSATGTATWKNGSLNLSLNAPNGDLGMAAGYPIVTIAVKLKSTAVPGTVSPFIMTLSGGSLLDPTGTPYTTEIAPGSITVGGKLAVTNVFPGGGLVPAGQPISITGMGFEPKMNVRIDTPVKYSYFVISPNEIRVFPQSPVNLATERIVFKTSTQTETYYSYLRSFPATPVGASVITKTKPLFPQLTITDGLLAMPSIDVGAAGFSLQNPSATQAQVTVSLYTPLGVLLGSQPAAIPAWNHVTVDLAALFPGLAVTPSVVRIQSDHSVAAVGLAEQLSTASVVPVPVTVVAP